MAFEIPDWISPRRLFFLPLSVSGCINVNSLPIDCITDDGAEVWRISSDRPNPTDNTFCQMPLLANGQKATRPSSD
jgi:hypothetical protein